MDDVRMVPFVRFGRSHDSRDGTADNRVVNSFGSVLRDPDLGVECWHTRSTAPPQTVVQRLDRVSMEVVPCLHDRYTLDLDQGLP